MVTYAGLELAQSDHIILSSMVWHVTVGTLQFSPATLSLSFSFGDLVYTGTSRGSILQTMINTIFIYAMT